MQWQSVACQVAPEVPFGPSPGAPAPSTVGDGTDYSAVTTGALFDNVTGSFPSISPGISEKGVVPVKGSPTMANTFSLQLNSSFFSSPKGACAGARKPSKCLAWQQFVLSTSPDSKPAAQPALFMQYWLIHYAANCPTGWLSYGNDCYTNSSSISTPVVTASELNTVSLEGTAKAGGTDRAILTVGTKVYAVSNSDSKVDLASNWTTAEFGLYGDGNGTPATFGSDTTLLVETATDNGTAVAPSCSDTNGGYTGETNNLSLVTTPSKDAGSTPSIVSRQSNAISSSASCVSG